MKLLLALVTATILALIPALAQCLVVVDASGGGQFLTIQEGVDAASQVGETVLVMPGVYDDWHVVEVFEEEQRVNVYFEKGITLVSHGGPEVTIIDGQGVTDYGVLAFPYDLNVPPIPPFIPTIDGFTVRNGSGTGIMAIGGTVQGCVVTDYNYGIASGARSYPTGIDGRRARDFTSIISGNTTSYNYAGIRIHAEEDGFTPADVIGNTVSHNDRGVYVSGPDNWACLAGNEISQNDIGVYIMPGPSTWSGAINLELVRNRIVDNESKNIRMYTSSGWGGYVVDLVIGGSPENANDIHGAPTNLSISNDASTVVDASYNYWGSILCDEFMPLFYTYGLADSLFHFLPFVDETHTAVYEDCEETSTRDATWGAIKALYR